MNQIDLAETKGFLLQSLIYSLPVRRLNVAEYHKMAEVGILSEDEHVELIDGVIIQMGSEGTKHSAIISKMAMPFYESVLEGKALLRVQNPIILNDETEPEPDLALVKTREDAYYLETHPLPNDVLLLIEVADATLRNDKEIKLPRYAASKIEEVWIVNLVDNIIEVYREPIQLANGTAGYLTRIFCGLRFYVNHRAKRAEFVKGNTLTPKALPSLEIAVDDVLI